MKLLPIKEFKMALEKKKRIVTLHEQFFDRDMSSSLMEMMTRMIYYILLGLPNYITS